MKNLVVRILKALGLYGLATKSPAVQFAYWAIYDHRSLLNALTSFVIKERIDRSAEGLILTNFLRRVRGRDVVITFTGGLGAQIISCAIYEYLQSEIRNVYADLSYFDARKGDFASNWDWELEEYSIPQERFAPPRPIHLSTFWNRRCWVTDAGGVVDADVKSALAFEALKSGSVRNLFPISQHLNDRCLEIEASLDYLCVHLRRGDYLYVASHIVQDEEFLQTMRRFRGITSTVVIVSDSDISDDFRAVVEGLFERQLYFIKSDVHLTHALMRNAKHLICSNSQFSITAALLNRRDGFIMVPCRYFGEPSERSPSLDSLCGFQLIDHYQIKI